MKIRITGNSEELKAITELLKSKEYIRSISTPYKNRGEYNKDCRLYIETYDSPEMITQIKAAQIQQNNTPGQMKHTRATEPGYKKLPAEATETAHNITISGKAYKKLLFLRDNNYFEPLTEAETLEDLINRSYENYKEVIIDGLE